MMMRATQGLLLWALVLPIPFVRAAENEELEPHFVGEFEFTERSGRTITLDDLKGRQWVASFIFTTCTQTCPRITSEMYKLQTSLQDTDVQIVSFTVDPDKDTPDVLKKYAAAYSADPDRWWFLTGDKSKLFSYINKSFLMPAGDKLHTNSVLHVDAQGQVLGKYMATNDTEMAALGHVLRGKMKTPLNNRFGAPSRSSPEPVPPQPSEPPEYPEWVLRLPKVNAALNATAALLLLAGYVLIRMGKVTAHKGTMLAAFATSMLFLTCYLVYHGYVGHREFQGTGVVVPIYVTMLCSHIVLAALVPGMAAVTIYRGVMQQWDKHKRIAKVLFPIWIYVSVTGVIIYFMLYHWSG